MLTTNHITRPRAVGAAAGAAALLLSMAGASSAHAVTPAYSSSLPVLQSQCLAQGERLNTPDVPGQFEIPSTQLSYGSTGVCVALVQTLLDDGAYVCTGSNYLSVDGQDGPATTAAVRCIQQYKGLHVDGQVGPETWSHIWWVN